MEVLIEKAPYIAGMIFIVILFLQHITRSEKRQEREALARQQQFEHLSKTCHEHTKELNDSAVKSIDNASRVIENNTKIIGAIERRMNGGPVT